MTATIPITFTNSTQGKFNDDNIYIYFNGPLEGTVNSTSEAIVPNALYTLADLAEGVRVSQITGRIHVSLGEPFQTNSQNRVEVADFLFKGTNPDTNSISIPWGFVELTYSPDIVSVLNLTNVDFFPFPISIKTTDAGGEVVNLDYQATGTEVKENLTALVLATTQDPELIDNTFRSENGVFLRILSPVHSPDAYPNLQPYVTAVHQKYNKNVFATLEGQYSRFGPADNQCRSEPNGGGVRCPRTNPSEPYSGSGDPSEGMNHCRYNTQTYKFTARFKCSASTRNNTLVLEGGGACIGDSDYVIEIPGDEVLHGIYTGIPPFTVNGQSPPDPSGNSNSNKPFDTNDVYNAAVRDLMAGFSFGFVDNMAGLGSNSKKWYNPPGIEGAMLAESAFADVNYSDPENNVYFFNAYQWRLFLDSDAYAYPYSDSWQVVQAEVSRGSSVDVSIGAV